MKKAVSTVHPDGRRRARIGTRLPSAAHHFVIIALTLLAIAPGLLLEQVSAAMGTLMETVVPTSEAVRDVAFAMERRTSSARGYFLTGADRYLAALEEARAGEAEALAELRALVPRVSVDAVVHLDSLEMLGAQRDSLEGALADADAEAYLEALPRFDAIQNAMANRLAMLTAELQTFAEERMAAEARWATLQRSLAFVL